MANKTGKMTNRSFSKNRAKDKHRPSGPMVRHRLPRADERGEEAFLRPEGLKRHHGQHFLTDRGILFREAEALQCEGKRVIEIGAGDGRLTKLILRQKPSELTAVELDKRWVAHLRKKLSGYKQAKVVQLDALELPDDYEVDGVIGNIPYYITSPLLVKLGKWKFGRAVLCVQKEVAERLAAKPGSSSYGRMSVYAQLHFEMEHLLDVPRTAFHPVPKVDSAVILLKPKAGAGALPPNLEAVSAALFSHRLASVANALLHSRRSWKWDKAQMREMARTVKYAQRKVLTLGPDEVLEIANVLPAMKGGKKTGA